LEIPLRLLPKTKVARHHFLRFKSALWLAQGLPLERHDVCRKIARKIAVIGIFEAIVLLGKLYGAETETFSFGVPA